MNRIRYDDSVRRINRCVGRCAEDTYDSDEVGDGGRVEGGKNSRGRHEDICEGAHG